MKNLVLLYSGVHSIVVDIAEQSSLSLMAVSAYLKRQGFACKVIGFNLDDTALRLLLNETLAVGMSVYTGVGIMASLALSARIRRLAPSLPIVWGGVHPTMEVEQTLANPLVDYVVRGEGEITFAELLNTLKNGNLGHLRSITGLSFKENGRQVHNPPRIASDINSLPMLDYDLYGRDFFKNGIFPYTSSRGCPYRCRFCCSAAMNRTHGKRFMQSEINRVANDLDTLVSIYSPRIIIFHDDAFLLNRARIKQVIEIFKSRHYPFEWTACSRCNVFAELDDDLLAGLKEIRIKTLFFGVESGSQRILNYINKQIRREDVIATISKLARYDLTANFSFINGFPGETRADVYESLSLMQEIKRISPASTVSAYVYTPQPGTEIYAECIAKHDLPHKATLESWVDGYEYHTSRPPWLPFQHRNMINVISWASVFDVLGIPPSVLGRIARKLLRFDWRLRLRTSTWRFGIEYLLINIYAIWKTRFFIRQCRKTISKFKPTYKI